MFATHSTFYCRTAYYSAQDVHIRSIITVYRMRKEYENCSNRIKMPFILYGTIIEIVFRYIHHAPGCNVNADDIRT